MKNMKRSIRRHQAQTHMWRRLKEDRNQHYDDLDCSCYLPGKAMARFKEQPRLCSCWVCTYRGEINIQEEKALLTYIEGINEHYSRDDF